MAKKILFGEEQVELNWATEETLQLVLRALDKKAKGEDSQTQRNRREENQNRKKTSKALEGLSKASGKAKDQIKDSGESAIKAFSEAETSISSFSKHVLGIVGVTGTLGAGFGIAAKVLDEYIDAQTAAAQSGFTFSGELMESRGALSRMGMNLTQFANILGENGSSIRALGDTGGQAARRFSDLVVKVRDATADFGYFGMTGQEMAGIMADKLDTLRKAGVGQENIAAEAAKSFDILNREVLGYARLTGRQRREIVRNRAAVDQDTYFLSAMNKLGDSALTSAQNMTDAFTAYFGEGSEDIIELLKGEIAGQLEGFPVLTTEQMGAINAIPGLGPALRDAANNFINLANDPAASSEQMRENVERIGSLLAAQEETLRRQSKLYAGDPVGQLSEQLLKMVVESRTALAESADAATEGTDPFNDAMNETTANMLKLKTDLEEFISSVQAATLSIFGIENGLMGINNVDFRDMAKKTRDFGTAMGEIVSSMAGMVEKINKLADSIGVGPTGKGFGLAAGALALGFGGFKLMKGVGKLGFGLGKKAVTGVKSLFDTVFGKKAMAETAKKITKETTKQAGRQAARGFFGRIIGKVLSAPVAAFTTGLFADVDPGQQTLDAAFQNKNPFPDDGTEAEQEEWQRQREEFIRKRWRLAEGENNEGNNNNQTPAVVPQTYSPDIGQMRREEQVMSQFVAPQMSEDEMRRQGALTPARSPVLSPAEKAQVDAAETMNKLYSEFHEANRNLRKMLDAIENQ